MQLSNKMKKITAALSAIIIILLILSLIYFVPLVKERKQKTVSQKIKENNEIFTQKIIEEFDSNKNTKASVAAKKVMDELNQTAKNPYDKKTQAFTDQKICKNCASIESDDKLSMVIISTYDKTGEMTSRIVIKPPSFVSYYKDDNN